MLRINPKFKIHQNLGKSKVDFISWRLCPFVLKIPIQNWLGEWFPDSSFNETSISFLSKNPNNPNRGDEERYNRSEKNFWIKQFFAYPIFSFKYAFFDFVTQTKN